MRWGFLSGLLWGLDTIILGIALGLTPFTSNGKTIIFAAIVGAFFHDTFASLWLFIYLGIKKRLHETWNGAKTKSGMVVILGATLGGPLGMSGYVVAIDNIGPAYTAVISSFYPAVGIILASIILKEHLEFKKIMCLALAVGGIIMISVLSTTNTTVENPTLGLAAAALCVLGWGSEAVFIAWGMRGEVLDNETALHLRETTSALIYALILIPLIGATKFSFTAISNPHSLVITLAGLAGASSFIFYYKAIKTIGASRAIALNVSYAAWAVIFGVLILQNSFSPLEILCCILILTGTILAASDWTELFTCKFLRKK